METRENPFYRRFGSPTNFRDYFFDIDCPSISVKFMQLLTFSRTYNKDLYESVRQQFLKLIPRLEITWTPSVNEFDVDVDISQTFKHRLNEAVAFMRLQPNAFKSEKIVPAGVALLFFCLTGSVDIQYKKKLRQLVRGSYITIFPNSAYSIRNTAMDQPSFLIFRISRPCVKNQVIF